jgi:hypothetical protein
MMTGHDHAAGQSDSKGFRPAGWLNLLRDTAYKASQRGRPC